MIQQLDIPYDVTLCVQREDLMHPPIQGNKYRKLKYNLAFAKANNYKTLITFGGAYSNHIAAMAIAGKIEGLKTVGVIRGEELGIDLNKTFTKNPTLARAKENGMQFLFISRSQYREKDSLQFKNRITENYPDAYLIPEGGTNELAIKGCREILDVQGHTFDFVCCPVGTGGTIAGIIESSLDSCKILGFPALKGDFLTREITKYTERSNWELINDYHFGGYSKVDTQLVDFINSFYNTYHMALDPVYTGKMFYGIMHLLSKKYFPLKSRILAIHTGGLQGIEGMNIKLQQKGLPIIHYKE